MNIFYVGVKYIALLNFIILLVSCNEHIPRQIIEAYVRECTEASEISLANIQADSTCKGKPFLIALAEVKDEFVTRYLSNILNYLIQRIAMDPNIQSTPEGMTATMAAIQSNNPTTARIYS